MNKPHKLEFPFVDITDAVSARLQEVIPELLLNNGATVETNGAITRHLPHAQIFLFLDPIWVGREVIACYVPEISTAVALREPAPNKTEVAFITCPDLLTGVAHYLTQLTQ